MQQEDDDRVTDKWLRYSKDIHSRYAYLCEPALLQCACLEFAISRFPAEAHWSNTPKEIRKSACINNKGYFTLTVTLGKLTFPNWW